MLMVEPKAASAFPPRKRDLPAELFQCPKANVLQEDDPPNNNPHVDAISVAAMSFSVPSRRLLRGGKHSYHELPPRKQHNTTEL